MDLTNEQWEVLQPLIPDPVRQADGRDRPWRDSRDVLNGLLWVLRTGALWRDLPERYPPYHTCHRRFQRGTRIKKVLKEQSYHPLGSTISATAALQYTRGRQAPKVRPGTPRPRQHLHHPRHLLSRRGGDGRWPGRRHAPRAVSMRFGRYRCRIVAIGVLGSTPKSEIPHR